MSSLTPNSSLPTLPTDTLREIDRIRKSISCIICLNVMNSPVKLNGCGHVYCVRCIEKAVETVSKCPLCGQGLLCNNQVSINFIN